MFSLLLSLLNCVQFHSLRTYRTSVFPLTLSLSSWKFSRAACPLQNSSSNSNTEKTVRLDQIQCPRDKINTKPNQRVHHRTERGCFGIETVYCFSVYTYRSQWKLYIGLCLSFEPLGQIQHSNIAYRTEGSVGQCFWTELNQCVYQSNHWSKSSVQI